MMNDFIVFIVMFSLTTVFFYNGICLLCIEKCDSFLKGYISICAGILSIIISLCSYVSLYIAVTELLK